MPPESCAVSTDKANTARSERTLSLRQEQEIRQAVFDNARRLLALQAQEVNALEVHRLLGSDSKLLPEVHLQHTARQLAGADQAAPDSGAQFVLKLNYPGMAGPEGPLPLEMLQELKLRAADPADALKPFTDLTQTALLEQYARAAALSAPAYSCDKTKQGQDTFAQLLLSLCGSMSPEPDVPESSALTAADKQNLVPYLSGLQAGSMQSLCAAATQLLHCKVTAQGNECSVQGIPEPLRTRLGRHSRLGGGAQLGRHYVSVSRSFTLYLEPADYAQLCDLLTGGRLQHKLQELLSAVLHRPLACTLQLCIKAQDVPQACLDGRQALGQPVRVGQRSNTDLCTLRRTLHLPDSTS